MNINAIFLLFRFFLDKIVNFLINKIFETILTFLSLKNEIYNFLIVIFLKLISNFSFKTS